MSRVLLVHIREEDEMVRQERLCFSTATGYPDDAFVSKNVVKNDGSNVDFSDISSIIVGGSGAFSATKEHPFYPAINEILDVAMLRSMPVWGSCWGHQYIARYLGGEVKPVYDQMEYGTCEVELTDEAGNDPVFSQMPVRYRCQQGHMDQVTRLTNDCNRMSHSELCPVQAFRVKDKPVYGTQFHPELTCKEFRDRMLVYKRFYPFKTDDEFYACYNNVSETPEANKLLRDFLDYYVT